VDGECRRDHRPEGSALFHSLLMGEFQKAITLSQYAADKHAVTYNQKPQHLGGTIYVMMHSIDFAELQGGQPA